MGGGELGAVLCCCLPCLGWVSGSPLQSLLGHVLPHSHLSCQWRGTQTSIPATSRAMLVVHFANTLNAQLLTWYQPTETQEALPGTSVPCTTSPSWE